MSTIKIKEHRFPYVYVNPHTKATISDEAVIVSTGMGFTSSINVILFSGECQHSLYITCGHSTNMHQVHASCDSEIGYDSIKYERDEAKLRTFVDEFYAKLPEPVVIELQKLFPIFE